MSKKLGLLLVVMLLTAIAAPVFAQGAFQDVPQSHWAYAAVDSLAKAGIIEGYPDSQFKGNRAMTRYEFAMVVARMLDKIPKATVGEKGEPGTPGAPGTPGESLTPEQKALLDKLANEFAPELKRLRDELGALEGRVKDLEARPANKPRVTVSGDISLRTGLYGTTLGLGAPQTTGYPYPWIGGNSFDSWFDVTGVTSDNLFWGGIIIPAPFLSEDPNIPATWDFSDGVSIPVSDALKDSFKTPQFMTMRSKVNFAADLGSGTKAWITLLADTRGNLFHPQTDNDPTLPAGFGGFTTPSAYYSDGLMDTVRIDEAGLQFNTKLIRPITITAGKLYWGFGQGLLVNNSQFPTKSVRTDIALTGDAVGEGITYTAIGAMLDREAFSAGETTFDGNLPNPPDPLGFSMAGQDAYFVQSIGIPIGRNWRVGGTYLNTGFGTERGWSVDAKGKAFGIDLWGEYAKLLNDPADETATDANNPVKLNKEDFAWLVGAGWNNSDFSVSGQYGEIRPLYAFSGGLGVDGDGWDPVGFATFNTFPFGTSGYLNLPLSLMHPLEEFNPHYINWLDRPLFLDPTNVAKGWEINATLKRVLGEKTPISFRYYTGQAYSEKFLGWLFMDGGADMSKPAEWRDADPVWSVTLTHHFNDAVTANLVYGHRAVDNVMSANTHDEDQDLNTVKVQNDPIQVLRLELCVSF